MKVKVPGFSAAASISSSRGHFRMDALRGTVSTDESVTMAVWPCPAGSSCDQYSGGTCTHCTGDCVPCSRHWFTGFCTDYCKGPYLEESQTSGSYFCWWGAGAHNKQECDTL